MSTNHLNEILHHKKAFASRKVGAEQILVPVKDNMTDLKAMLSLNASASLLWDNLSADSSLESLSDVLCEQYEIDKKTAQTDVEQFVRTLHEFMMQ